MLEMFRLLGRLLGHTVCSAIGMLIALIISLWTGISIVLCLALFGIAAKPVPGFARDASRGDDIALEHHALNDRREGLVLATQ